jgi:ureidoglycolate lyase
MEKLNNIMNLQIKKISKDNFSKYGQLVSTKDIESQNINEETTKSFYDLVNIEIYGDDKKCRVNIFKSIKRNFPLEINMLENHPFSSQAFIPLQKTNFIVVVAPISSEPDINLIETFLISPEEGINFKPKVWHFPLIATENSNFLTIDKKDSANNIEIYNFQNNDKIFLNYE